MLTLDTVAWHAMVIGHVKCGKGQKVIGTILLAKCNRKGVETESVTFLEALYAFTNLVTRSKEPYMFMSTLFKLVFECNLFVHNWLIIMYVKLWQSEGWLDMVSKMVIGVED
jgi:hypothetical protein